MTTTEFENDTNTQKSGKLSNARAKAGEKLGSARNKASDAYSSARERTSSAYGTARERASNAASTATRKTAEGVEASPVGALVGGLALGALIAAVLPKSRREQELLGTYGRRVNETAREAAKAAKEAGRDKLDELGLNQDTAKQKLSDIASKAGEAARTSATAAAQTVKGSSQQQ